MTDRFDYYIHGVNVQIEYTHAELGLYVRRAGFGTVIRQNQGTSNWFHLAIPTPTFLDDGKVNYLWARLRGWINNGATVEQVHVWHGRSRILTNNVSLSARDIDEPFDLSKARCTNPIVMCVFVNFDGEDGEIRFDGAGVQFEEWEF